MKELSGPVGMRERKRAETHARIQAEAMRLFLERGFDAVTLDDIAAAVDVSRRSLFHYFESKEEIVFSTKAEFPRLVAEALGRRPPDEPLMDMAENAMIEMATLHIPAQARNYARLIRDTPALRAGDQAKYEYVERLSAKVMAERKGLPENDLACRVTAATAVGIIKLAMEAWLTKGGPKLDVFIKDAFAALRNVAVVDHRRSSAKKTK
jgi:AcrR family transcriptional regulator